MCQVQAVVREDGGGGGVPRGKRTRRGQLVDSGQPTPGLCVRAGGTWAPGGAAGGPELAGLGRVPWWGWVELHYAGPQTSLAFFLLVTGKGALTGVSGGTTFVPRACQGWSLGLLGEVHAVPVQPCPPGRPGGSGQEALVWLAPTHKPPSPCPEGALTLHVGFSF